MRIVRTFAIATTVATTSLAGSIAAAPAAPVAGPTMTEHFSSWPKGGMNAAGTMRINGDWMGTANNTLRRSNVVVTRGAARMVSRANVRSGAELQTSPNQLHGVGYHEASIRMSSVPGIVSGIFFISKDYTAPEVDLEVRSRDNGPGRTHYAFLTVRQGDGSRRYQQVKLPFDPAGGYHTYGIQLGSTSVSFHADGRRLATMSGLKQNLGGRTALRGYVMTNSWAEDSAWTGPLPTRDTATWVNWMKTWDGATTPRYSRDR